MNMNHLEYFIAVTKFGGISRAAESLNVSKSAISDAIKQLENELNGSLFKRVGRNLVLTEMGREFLDGSDKLVKDSFSLVQDMRSFNNQKHTIKIGTAAITGAILFPYLLSGSNSFMDTVTLKVDCDKIENLLQQVEDELLDICFVEGPFFKESVESNLSFQKLRSSHLNLCIYDDHPLNKRESVSFEEIIREPVILFKDGYQSKIVMDEYKANGIRPNVAFISNQIYTVSSIVQQKRGIAFMDACITPNLPGIKVIPITPNFSYDIWIVWKSSRQYSRYIKEFVNYLLSLDYEKNHNEAANLK